MSNSQLLLDRILEPGSLQVAYQPILELSEGRLKTFALEFLIRGPHNTSLEEPLVLFEYARQKRAEILVDRACLSAILQAADQLTALHQISVNVQPATIGCDADFPEFLFNLMEINRIRASSLILEIAGQTTSWDRKITRRSLCCLRERGVRIALCGFGGRYSNYQMWLEFEPDFIKLDPFLVSQSGSDLRRRVIMESFARLARQFNLGLIAEGIANVSDLEAVTESGITLLQGFLCAGIQPVELLPELLTNKDVRLSADIM